MKDMKSALCLAMDVIVKLGKEITKSNRNNDEQLGQLEDVESMGSLIDILRFISTDHDNYMI